MDFFLFSLLLGYKSAILTYYKQIIFPVSPMDFCLGEFLPRRLLPQKDPLDKNECPGNVSPYLAKSADISNFNHLGNLFTENVMNRQEAAIPQ